MIRDSCIRQDQHIKYFKLSQDNQLIIVHLSMPKNKRFFALYAMKYDKDLHTFKTIKDFGKDMNFTQKDARNITLNS